MEVIIKRELPEVKSRGYNYNGIFNNKYVFGNSSEITIYDSNTMTEISKINNSNFSRFNNISGSYKSMKVITFGKYKDYILLIHKVSNTLYIKFGRYDLTTNSEIQIPSKNTDSIRNVNIYIDNEIIYIIIYDSDKIFKYRIDNFNIIHELSIDIQKDRIGTSTETRIRIINNKLILFNSSNNLTIYNINNFNEYKSHNNLRHYSISSPYHYYIYYIDIDNCLMSNVINSLSFIVCTDISEFDGNDNSLNKIKPLYFGPNTITRTNYTNLNLLDVNNILFTSNKLLMIYNREYNNTFPLGLIDSLSSTINFKVINNDTLIRLNYNNSNYLVEKYRLKTNINNLSNMYKYTIK